MSYFHSVLRKRRKVGDATAKILTFPMLSIATGGVAPVGWINSPATTLLDEALNDYDVVWAAAGHPHAVSPHRLLNYLKQPLQLPHELVINDLQTSY